MWVWLSLQSDVGVVSFNDAHDDKNKKNYSNKIFILDVAVACPGGERVLEHPPEGQVINIVIDTASCSVYSRIIHSVRTCG